jgi:hypothetical protein
MTSQYGAYALECWISKATRTHARARMQKSTLPGTRKHAHRDKYVILMVFHDNGYVNAPQWYVIRTLLSCFFSYLRLYRGLMMAVN